MPQSHESRAKLRAYNRQKQQEYRLADPDRYRSYKLRYRLAHLEQEREKGRIREAKRRKEQPDFQEKSNASKKQWRINNPEKAKAKAKQDRNTRRARQAQAVSTLSVAQEQEIKAAKGYRCDYCGKKAKDLTIDHISPLGPDGPDTLWNATAACMSCNARKGRKNPPKPVQPLLLTLAPAKKKKG